MGALQPYIGAGKRSLGKYESGLDEMRDPQEYLSQLLGGYEQSPFAKQQEEAGMGSLERSAAMTGMQGSGAEKMALERQSQQISQADQQRYLDNLYGIHSQYLGGESNIAQMGLGGIQTQITEQARQQETAESRRREQQQRDDAFWSDIAGAIGQGAGMAMSFA